MERPQKLKDYEVIGSRSREPFANLGKRKTTMFTWNSYRAAKASLCEFTPAWRTRHRIVRFWSNDKQRWLYGRQLIS